MSLYRWLHISDLHFKTGDDPDQENMIATLLVACKNGKIQADFVIATGDFHNFTDKDNFEPAKTFLQSLIGALGLDISSDLFLVPGNHDQQPSAEKTKFMFALKSKSEKKENLDYSAYLTANSIRIQAILDDFYDYSQLATSLIKLYNPTNPCPVRPEDVHVRTWNNSINFLHLNTAVLSDGCRDHAEGIDIATACSPEIREMLDNGLPTLVLGHHSFFDLHPSFRDRLVQLFNQTNVWAYLAGDRHRLNFHGEDYLIDRKIGIAAWPNIVAGEMAASVDDTFANLGVIRYCWETDKNTVTPEHLVWERNSSGSGFTSLGWESLRPFPMYAKINSKLYFDLMESLAETRRTHPSFQLMEIDETLYPKGFRRFELSDCRAVGDKIEEARPMADFFSESWRSPTQNHLMLEGEGGIGKTVAVLSLITQKSLLPHNVPGIYIPLHRLRVSKEENSISRYICDEILLGDRIQFGELLSLSNMHWENGPRLVLLLDGFNEISLHDRYTIARDIEAWSRKNGVQTITASRFDVRNTLPGLSGEYHTIKLQPLPRDIISEYLLRNNVKMPDENSSLWDVIDYPLMLMLYSQTEVARNQRCAVPLAWRVAENAGEIIWNYLQQELLRCSQSSGNCADALNSVIATEYIAPFISWQMVRSNRFTLTEEEFEGYLSQATEHWRRADRTALPKHIRQVMRHTGGALTWPEIDSQFGMLTNRLNLFRIQENANGNIIRLMHQRFRDCFAAIHLINLTHAMPKEGLLSEAWRHSVDYYVMDFIADLIEETEAALLWEANREIKPTNQTAMRTMLELQKRKRQCDFSCLNFSDLDLRKIHLHAYRWPGKALINLPSDEALFENCYIGLETFMPEGHMSDVTAVAITPGGNRCVSASSDYTLRVWDMATGACLHVLEGHASRIYAVAITPDGSRCVSASWDNTLRIWDMAAGAFLYVLEGHKSSVYAVAITPDGSRCVSASWDNTLRVWDIATGACMQVLEGHSSYVSATAITSDCARCVSASRDNTLRVWDMATGACLYVLAGHTDNVNAVAITSDGGRCISTSEDETLRIWDIARGTCLHVLEGHEDNVTAVAITPDDGRCVSASSDDSLRIWDIATGECLHELKGHTHVVDGTAITPDGRRCVSMSRDYTLRIWDMATGICLNVLNGHTGNVNAVAIAPDGDRCVSASEDRTLRIWDIKTGVCLYMLKGYDNCAKAVEITADGSRCVSMSEENSLRVWDIKTGTCLQVLEGHTGLVYALALTPDGVRCVSASFDNSLRIWNMATGVCLNVLEGHTRKIFAVAITPDGNRCVSASSDTTLRIWDMATGVCLHVLEGHTQLIAAVAITPDGSRCVSASCDNTLRIWDMATGICLHVLTGHMSIVEAVAIAPDGSRCVSISSDKTLRIWGMATGVCLHLLEGNEDSIKAVAITPDGSRCVCASFDDTLHIWSMTTGAYLYALVGHKEWVNAVAIAPDGSRCISASRDNTLRIWDMETGVCLHVLEGHTDNVMIVKITQDGSRCVSASDDRTLRIWDMETGVCLKIICPIPGINLSGVNLKKAIITPHEHADVLRQNGAIVANLEEFSCSN